MITIKRIVSVLKSKNTLIIGGFIITFIAGVLSPYLSKTLEHVTEKHFTSKELIYEVTSVDHYKKHELTDSAKSCGIDSFDLKLDDPLLSDYSLARIKLKNWRGPINSPVRFDVSIGTTMAKIVDVKFKIVSPANKSMTNVHSLPNLTWALPKVFEPKLSWEAEEPGMTAGYYMYRSFLRDKGYGRINHELLTEPTYKFEKNSFLSETYYRMSVVGTNGWESDLGEPLAFPDFIALTPVFKNCVNIYPGPKKEKFSRTDSFASLAEAMAKASPSKVYLVHKRRDDIVKGEDLSNDPRVFYEDNLEFLKGNVKISLLDGIDEDGEIDFFILYKVLPGQKSDLRLAILGTTGTNLNRVGETKSEIAAVEKKDTEKDKKRSLTPTEVKTYLGKGVIYLVWKKPESADYKGVRVFRSKKRNWEDLKNLGKELYQGTGFTKIIECNMQTRQPIDNSFSIIPYYFARNKADDFKPPYTKEEAEYSKRGPAPPKPVTGMRLVDVLGAKGELIYGDDTASPNTVYTYTLIAFDSSKTYSYPILMNASSTVLPKIPAALFGRRNL